MSLQKQQSENAWQLYVCSRTGRFISTFDIKKDGVLERVQIFHIDGAPRNIAIDYIKNNAMYRAPKIIRFLFSILILVAYFKS